MAVRPIVVWPDPRLREETRPIAEINQEILDLYRDLVDTMFAHNGIGIASIQIGVPLRMFLLDAQLAGGTNSDDPLAFINPEIVSLGDEIERADEGCLSFPEIYVPIERSLVARVRAQNLTGEWFELEGEGLLARAMQHENDHLTGRLLVDFVGPLKKRSIKRRLERAHREANDTHPAAGE